MRLLVHQKFSLSKDTLENISPRIMTITSFQNLNFLKEPRSESSTLSIEQSSRLRLRILKLEVIMIQSGRD
jgi:hypothetical protein